MTGVWVNQIDVTVMVKSTGPSSAVLAVSWKGRSNGQGPVSGDEPGSLTRDRLLFVLEYTYRQRLELTHRLG